MVYSALLNHAKWVTCRNPIDLYRQTREVSLKIQRKHTGWVSEKGTSHRAKNSDNKKTLPPGGLNSF